MSPIFCKDKVDVYSLLMLAIAALKTLLDRPGPEADDLLFEHHPDSVLLDPVNIFKASRPPNGELAHGF